MGLLLAEHMATRMSPQERAHHYGGRIHVFEHANGWNIGKYAVSEVLAIIALAAFLSWGLPQVIAPSMLFTIGLVFVGLLILYLILVFSLSGGRGKVVDVI